jgi:flagellar biogenesis protein FliO
VRALCLANALMLLPHSAHAYVGPGVGLGALMVAVAVALAFLLLLVGFIWYPLKRLIRGRKPALDKDRQKDR